MYSSQETFFVLSLTEDLEYLVESSFYLSYYSHIQPSEIDRLTTYEFRKYLDLMKDQVKSDREFETTLARGASLSNLAQLSK